jgi:hypothetical protein
MVLLEETGETLKLLGIPSENEYLVISLKLPNVFKKREFCQYEF